MLRLLWILVVMALLALVAVFAYFNATPVELSYLSGEVSMPLSLIVAVAFALGCIFCYFLYLPFFFGQKAEIRRLQRLDRKTLERKKV
ncbi:MAG: LapA family protein [Gammaproteobacteria bacterium]|nr:LapA family protein [Gammaproteobacteria bacterium]